MGQVATEPLDYAPRPRRRRWKYVRRTLAAIVLVLASLAARKWGPQAWDQAQLLHWQNQCLTYAAPPDKVICEEGPEAALKLLSESPAEYQPFHLVTPGETVALEFAKPPQYTYGAAARPPEAWTNLGRWLTR